MARLSSRALSGWHPLVLVPLALAAWVYHPIVRVFFFADDVLHLNDIANKSALAFVLAPFGGHNYLVRNLVFLGSWQLFGLRTELWYGVVLLTHLLNVWLLFRVLGTLTASVRLACFGATIWGISPLGVGTLGVYSVYGQVMAATVLLVVLDGLTRLGTAREPVPVYTASLWYALLLAGTTCFGTGIGVALVFPLVLFLLLPAAWRQRGVRLAYLALPAVTLAAYFELRRLSALIEPLPLEEVLHVVVATRGLLVAPAMVPPLLGFGVTASTLGHFLDAQAYPDARAWGSVIAVALGLGLVAWRGDAGARRAALAMAALSVGIYGVIAVGRASVYANVYRLPLTQVATEPRYHYMGTIPIIVLLCQILQQVGRIGWVSSIPRDPLLAAGLGLAVAGYARSSIRIDEHAAARAYFTRTGQEIDAAVAAAPPGTTVYLENQTTPFDVLGWAVPNRLFPGRAAVFLLTQPSARVDGREVRFVERDRAVLDRYRGRSGTPLGRLLVAPEDARTHP
jgi:hypothetical protein